MQQKEKNAKKRLQNRLYYIIFTVLTSALMPLFARLNPQFSDWIDARLGAPLRAALSRLSSLAAVSLAEWLALSLPFIVIFVFVLALRRGSSLRRAIGFLLSLLYAVSVFLAVYSFSFGSAYGKTPFYRSLGIEVGEVDGDSLYSAVVYLTEQLSAISQAPVEGHTVSNISYTEIFESLADAYALRFGGTPPRIKLSSTSLFSRLGIRGLYFPYLGEITVNREMPPYNIPFTAAHEMAHRYGVAREGEAGFLAFLVCIGSPEPYIRYSGYLSAYEYLSSELWEASPELYFRALKTLPEYARLDILADREYASAGEMGAAVGTLDGIRDAHLAVSGSGNESYSFLTRLVVSYISSQSR